MFDSVSLLSSLICFLKELSLSFVASEDMCGLQTSQENGIWRQIRFGLNIFLKSLHRCFINIHIQKFFFHKLLKKLYSHGILINYAPKQTSLNSISHEHFEVPFSVTCFDKKLYLIVFLWFHSWLCIFDFQSFMVCLSIGRFVLIGIYLVSYVYVLFIFKFGLFNHCLSTLCISLLIIICALCHIF